VLRLARIAIELDLEPDEQTLRSAREHVDELRRCSPERVFAELRRIVAAEQALRGLQLMDALSATAVVLPELDALRDVEQNRFHHADVYQHTLEVLARTIALTEDVALPDDTDRASAGPPPTAVPAAGENEGRLAAALESTIGDHRAELAALLAEPLADGLTRGEALRWGALLPDAAKPLTRDVRQADGRVTFIGHDERGAALAREVLGRLRCSERLRAHVAALVRHHLRLGFLVHEPQPLSRRTVFGYLSGCVPVEVDVTLLSVADRLATRGDRAQESIEAHLAVARQMLPEALRWRADGPPAPLLRGDELARELGIATGPRLGELLAALSEAQFAGEIATREQAVARARELV
jgi:poly(A) polymerase